MTALPLDAAGRRPAFFEQEGLDQLLSMVLELAAEVWVTRERLFLVESVAGPHIRAAVEEYKPSAEERATLDRMRAEMTAQLFRNVGRVHRNVA